MAPERRDLAAAWRAIDELRWRMAEREQAAQKYIPVIEDLVKSDEIAEAIATKMEERHALGFTNVQKWTAIAGVFIAAAALVASVLASAGLL